MSVRWHSYPDPAQAAGACAHHLLALIEDALSGQERVTVALSGGSTPGLLFDEMVKARFNWESVHLFWVDERAVPPTDPLSNYKLADERLIRPAPRPTAQRAPHSGGVDGGTRGRALRG